jgi:dihydrofolate reductase
MQITVDGFVAGPAGQLDWMTRAMDEQLLALINELTDSSSTILLGRKMTPGFVAYWEGVLAKPEGPEHAFARKMVDMEKVVFSRTIDHVDGQNVRVHRGDLVEGVDGIRHQPGKDIVVYGGATFVASLIEHTLIDELNLFVNPVAIADGMRAFTARTPLRLVESKAYPSGVIVSTYGRR